MKFLGLAGFIFLNLSGVLQAIKFIRVKRTEGISIGYWWMLITGMVCFGIYGFKKDIFWAATNIIGVISIGTSIALYYYYSNKNVSVKK